MVVSYQNYAYGQVMPILNRNRITDDKKREAIKAMGMSACQAGCMSRGCCSKCHGNGHRT